MKKILIQKEQETVTRNYFEYYDRQCASINGFIRKVTTIDGTTTVDVEVNNPVLVELDKDTIEFIKQHYKKTILNYE